MATSARRYSGSLLHRYQVDVPGDPGRADPAAHNVDEGHLVDTSGRDEAPRGGGWMAPEFLELPPGPADNRTVPEFTRSHRRTPDHRRPDGGGTEDQVHAGALPLRWLRALTPQPRPNDPETLDDAGAAGAANGGLRGEGMAPWMQGGRRRVDGKTSVPPLRLGQTYLPPMEHRRTPLHFNRPRLRRVLAPSINVERGGPSPGGYSSAFDSSVPQRTSGPSNPTFRRLIQAYGQAPAEEVTQRPSTTYTAGGGPIGNSGW